jgi:NAD(P)-dependent dehydrogenase (short-subunit alcohol dehydrogenase family)
LCNNAGVVTAGPLQSLSLGDWEWVLGVNLWGAIHGVKTFLPILLEQDEAHVVSTASTAGLVAAPHLGPYNVSKFGVVALMETLAREMGVTKARVGVSVLCPGPIDTRIVDAERNRPDVLRAGHVETREERAFLTGAKGQLAEGLAPERVAELVLAAVRAERFWILTHPEWKPLLERRLAALIEHDALPPRYP